MNFFWKAKEENTLVVIALLSVNFLCMGMITPVCLSFGVFSEKQVT